MGRATWNTIKYSKMFYIRTYRKGLRFLVVSMSINFFLSVAIAYTHLHRPDSAYYATSGIVPPVRLTALVSPNYSAKALLPADPVTDNKLKAIPK